MKVFVALTVDIVKGAKCLKTLKGLKNCEAQISNIPVSSIQLHSLFLSVFLKYLCRVLSLHHSLKPMAWHFSFTIFTYQEILKNIKFTSRRSGVSQLVKQNSSLCMILKVVFNSTSFVSKMKFWD